MTGEALFAFAGVIAAHVLAPAPGKIALLSRTLERGRLAGAVMAAGFLGGNLVLLTLALTGLTAFTEGLSAYAEFFRIAGALVLTLIALSSIGRAIRPQAGEAGLVLPPAGAHAAGFVALFALAVASPRGFVLYLSVTPSLFALETLSAGQTGLLYAVLLGVGAGLLGAAVLAVHQARRLLSGPGPTRALSLINAAVMLGVAALLLVG